MFEHWKQVFFWLVGLALLIPTYPYAAGIATWIWANPALFAGLMAVAVGFSLSISWHELGHWISAQWRKMETPVFSLGLGPRKWSWLIGTTGKGDRKTEWILSPFVIAGGYVKIKGLDDPISGKEAIAQAINSKKGRVFKVWERSAVAFAGPLNNFILAFALFAVVFFFQGKPFVESTYIEQYTNTSSIARDVGFQPGDVFVSIDGKKVTEPADVINAIHSHKNTAANVVISRAGKNITILVTPNGNGQIGIDISPKIGYQRESVLDSIQDGGKTVAITTGQIYQNLFIMVHPSSAPANLPPGALDVHGVVAIFQIGMVVFAHGIWSFLTFMAKINVMLAVMNLLPFPLLDGGYLMFFAIEKLRGGKPVNAKVRHWLQMGTIYMLAVLTTFALWNDIFNPVDLTQRF